MPRARPNVVGVSDIRAPICDDAVFANTGWLRRGNSIEGHALSPVQLGAGGNGRHTRDGRIGQSCSGRGGRLRGERRSATTEQATRRVPMGDKGGKKDKQKAAKQKASKQKQNEKRKEAKRPKSGG